VDREACLASLSRLLDGRPVSAEERAAAHARLAHDAECAAIWADMQTAHASLAAEPPVLARPGFADRVLAARRRDRARSLPFVRRLAVAAGLAMLLTAGFGLARPGVLLADPGVERERHHIDVLKPSPYAPADLEAGLDALLRDSDPHRRLTR
jgi:ferric-dicitrate binding protein FerR (iron transport regulator)